MVTAIHARVTIAVIHAPIGFSSVSYRKMKGMDNYKWSASGGTGPRMTTRDYARLAYLLLQNGKWEDKYIFYSEYLNIFKTSANYPNIRSSGAGCQEVPRWRGRPAVQWEDGGSSC